MSSLLSLHVEGYGNRDARWLLIRSRSRGAHLGILFRQRLHLLFLLLTAPSAQKPRYVIRNLTRAMDTELTEYKCSEFFEDYYSNGLFDPTEAKDLLPHTKIAVDPKQKFLQIGRIWDDHDLILGYRKGEEGVWGRSNYDGSFLFFAKTIKDFTEGWYQGDGNYWATLAQGDVWKGIERHYQLNTARYNWKADALLDFVRRGRQHQISDELFLIAYETRVMQISINNAFYHRPDSHMANLFFNDNLHEYRVDFHLDFFEHSHPQNYKVHQLDEMIGDIRKWIMKSG